MQLHTKIVSNIMINANEYQQLQFMGGYNKKTWIVSDMDGVYQVNLYGVGILGISEKCA